MNNDFTEIVKTIVVEGTKAMAVEAGILVLATLLAGGLSGLKTVDVKTLLGK